LFDDQLGKEFTGVTISFVSGCVIGKRRSVSRSIEIVSPVAKAFSLASAMATTYKFEWLGQVGFGRFAIALWDRKSIPGNSFLF